MRQLSHRLQTVLALLQNTACLGDIGSDHAFLVAAAVLQGKAARGIAVELCELPWRQSKRTVHALGLSEVVDVRLGDGLEPLLPGEVHALCIAGMGGGTIRGILERGRDKLTQVSQMVLQPNVDAGALRSYLCDSGYRIADEAVVEEASVVYQGMRAEPSREGILYTPLELEYGRINLKRLDSHTVRLLERDFAHWQRVESSLQAGRPEGIAERRQWVNERVSALREVLANVR
ncbi:MAG: tRNA (adenine(22)-N(1))-methyltransferase [Firmicutes bacterium]|nr:tRNA (adenine(22)-N(1))-methyltransferase [Bacillota bacterium]